MYILDICNMFNMDMYNVHTYTLTCVFNYNNINKPKMSSHSSNYLKLN